MSTVEMSFDTGPAHEIAIVPNVPSGNLAGCRKRADITVEDERYYTLLGLQKLFRVSSRTISRWEKLGLDSCHPFGDGRRKGFLGSTVQRFITENRELVERAAKFSQLTPDERDRIIEHARRLSANGLIQAEINRRVAKLTGRSVEAVRYTLKQFDEENPDSAAFSNRTGPPNEKMKKETRARRILELDLDYMYNESFDKPGADKEILGPMPPGEEGNGRQRKPRAPAGLPPYLASLYETPLLTREQEHYLFCKFNYLKHKASRLREGLDPSRARSSVMDKIKKLYEEAVQTKNDIVQANLRLVVSIAKRYVTETDDFFSLVSDGNMSLIRAVEKFDCFRGNKFSTYASWAIIKNFARTIPDEHKHRDRFRTSLEEMFVSKVDDRADQFEQENAQRLREEQVGRILSRLDEREQKIIIARFGLDHSQEPQTLKEVAADLGVTKERVRQIEARALNKLRLAVREEKIPSPE